jgi:hypothetical protein
MKNKPLILLEVLEKFKNKKGELFEVVKPKNILLEIIDKEKNSNFYFNILDYKINEKFEIQIDRKPQSKRQTKNYQEWIEASELETKFNAWIKLLEEYEKLKE